MESKKVKISTFIYFIEKCFFRLPKEFAFSPLRGDRLPGHARPRDGPP